MGGIAPLEVRAKRVALDGLGQDHRRLALVLHRRPVGCVHLAVVVAAAFEVPDVVVAHVLYQRLGSRVAAEEVLPHIGAVVGLVGLEVTIGCGVHQIHQGAVLVGVQQGIPLAAPHHLDDVPAGAAEEGLQLLNDLAVAAHRPVESLQVAVDDEGQVVQAFERGDVGQAATFRLVGLTIAEEGPHMLVRGVLDATVMQVVVEPGLINRVHRTQTHRHRGELPEVGHQPRVRVGRQPAAGVGVLLTEAVHPVRRQPALQEGAGVDAGGGVSLDEDLIAAARVGFAAEEVIETHLVERGRGGVGGDVAAYADAGALGAVHHDRGIPPDPAAVAAFDLLVAGKPWLQLGRDGVDVVGRGQGGDCHTLLARALKQAQHQVAGPGRAGAGQQVVERLEPFRGLVGVDIGQIRRHTVADDPDPIGFSRAT